MPRSTSPIEPPALLTEQAALDARCEAWRANGVFAFDTEFIREDSYDAHLCLLQVATADEVTLIDPTCGLDLTAFWELVADPEITAVVHAGKEDFELCHLALGRPPRNVFDVQIAAGFAGYGYPLSLARLMQMVLRRRIVKGQTLTDWARRPLTKNQLRYAVEDVAHLPAAYDKLHEKLTQRARLEWAREEFARFEDPATYDPPPRARLFKLKGSKKLDALGLAVLERLIAWRENWAAQRQRPTRALMRDDILVAIAKRRPGKATDLEVLRGFPQAKNPRIIREILDLITAVENVPADEYPKPFVARAETPGTRSLLDIMAGYARGVCQREDIDYDLVGNLQRLHELLDFELELSDTQPVLLAGWRRDFIGAELRDLLRGNIQVRVEGFPTRPHVVGRPRAKRRS